MINWSQPIQITQLWREDMQIENKSKVAKNV